MTDPVVLPFCGAAPTAVDLWSRWAFDVRLLALLAALPILYRLASALAGGDAAPGRARFFWIGWATLAVAFVSPLCALSVALFSARVAHHVLLVAVAAPFLALANPWRGRGRIGRIGVWLAVHAALLWFWHAPLPYEAALRSDALYWLMQGSLVASAVVFWAALLDPRTGGLTSAAYGLAAMMQMGFLGALITFTPRPLYAAHALTTEAFGLSPLADQQLAGLVMWVPGAMPYLVVALLCIARMLSPGALERPR